MADDMIERVEIAIRQAINTHWDGMILTGGHGLLARAAILAVLAGVREPSAIMRKAGSPKWMVGDREEAARCTWQAMLDALAKEIKDGK